MHRAVLHLVVLAGTAGHHDDVRARHVGQPRPGGKHQAAFLVPDGTGAFGDERHLGAGQPAEHLVGADRVEDGEPVEEQDGDLHDSPRQLLMALLLMALLLMAGGRNRRRYSPGLTPRARMKARRIASGVP